MSEKKEAQKSQVLTEDDLVDYQKVAEIIHSMVMDCLDEVVPLEHKKESELLELEEVVALSVETAMMVVQKLSLRYPFDREKLRRVGQLMDAGEVDLADDLLLEE